MATPFESSGAETTPTKPPLSATPAHFEKRGSVRMSSTAIGLPLRNAWPEGVPSSSSTIRFVSARSGRYGASCRAAAITVSASRSSTAANLPPRQSRADAATPSSIS